MAAKKTAGWRIGTNYLVRTVTHYYSGKLLALTPGELVLGEAAWIPDTGRFSVAVADGVLSEVEPYPGEVLVMRGAVVDACKWKHALPRERK